MKLRMRANSIRLRLTQTEVKRFVDEGIVSESTVFGDSEKNVFRYSLKRSDSMETIPRFENNEITVSIPSEIAVKWACSEEVSLVHEVTFSNGEKLRLLVEKDFRCINPQRVWPEDESDGYPNPNPSCGDYVTDRK